MQEKIEIKVQGITYNPLQSGAYALLLAEVGGERRIPVVVGASEAQSIAMRLEGVIPPRPITHDLLTSIMHAYGLSIDEVLIYKFDQGVFMSELHLSDGEREVTLDCRTSDAIAMALRTGARIFTTPAVIDKTGIIVNEEEEKSRRQKQRNRKPSELTVEELQKRLNAHIEREEYELAAQVQQLIKQKQQ